MKQLNLTNATDSTLEIINGVLMMSSRSIARTVDKEHKQVVRDIKTLLEQLGVYGTDLHYDDSKGFLIIKKEYNGRTVIDEIWLNEDLSITLVTGYDPKRRLGIISQWRVQKEELAQLRISVQPEPQPASANEDILSLARVVAEATASAAIKAVMETTTVFASPRKEVRNVGSESKPLLSPLNETFDDIREWFDKNPIKGSAQPKDEYVQVVRISRETTLSDTSSRKLIGFANLPTRKFKGSNGLLVHRESFMLALRTLIDESTPPTGKRKRWQHPEFGKFSLKRDPQEIFGEAA